MVRRRGRELAGYPPADRPGKLALESR